MRPKRNIETLTEGHMGKVESPHPGRRGAMSVERLRLRWPMAKRKVEVEEKVEEEEKELEEEIESEKQEENLTSEDIAMDLNKAESDEEERLLQKKVD